jgi:hypothetical protein
MHKVSLFDEDRGKERAREGERERVDDTGDKWICKGTVHIVTMPYYTYPAYSLLCCTV